MSMEKIVFKVLSQPKVWTQLFPDVVKTCAKNYIEKHAVTGVFNVLNKIKQ